jgi:hypothetical protein
MPTCATTAEGSLLCSSAVLQIELRSCGGIHDRRRFQWLGCETIFKLDNGQIWEQAEYAYMYSYSYRPDVTIYQTNSGCRLKVEGDEETILVKRIK